MSQQSYRMAKLEKYRHIIQWRRLSSKSKSKKPWLYIFFLDYEDPVNIPYFEISKDTGEKIDTFKGMKRAAMHNDTIALALVDIGVEAEDIPRWFARNERLLPKRVKRSPGPKTIPVKVSISPEVAQKYPYDEIVGFMESSGRYNRNSIRIPAEPYVSQRVEAMRNAINRDRAQEILDSLQRESKKKELPLEVLLAMAELEIHERQLQEEAERALKNVIFSYILELNKPTFTHQDVKNFIEAINHIIDKNINIRPQTPPLKIEDIDLTTFYDMNKWVPIETEINKLDNTFTQDKKEGFKALAEFAKELQDQSQKRKLLRHGNIIKMPEVYWPPDYEPIDVDPRSRSRKT